MAARSKVSRNVSLLHDTTELGGQKDNRDSYGVREVRLRGGFYAQESSRGNILNRGAFGCFGEWFFGVRPEATETWGEGRPSGTITDFAGRLILEHKPNSTLNG